MKSKWNFLSLCQKTGFTVSGDFSVMEALKAEKIRLLLLATDASENTKKKWKDKAAFRSLPIYEIGTKEELGRALGKEIRTIVAILDQGLANGLLEKMEENE